LSNGKTSIAEKCPGTLKKESEKSHTISPTGFLVAMRNDRQKIELNVEILEGILAA
jgi:hypothetical protein